VDVKASVYKRRSPFIFLFEREKRALKAIIASLSNENERGNRVNVSIIGALIRE